MGFGADSIAVVTGGLRYSTGTFAERLVSSGYIGDITTTVVIIYGGSVFMILTMQL